jgi:hypothetical protein
LTGARQCGEVPPATGTRLEGSAATVPKRAVFATLAWVAATATAMAVVWTGLDAVLPVATQGPRVASVAAWPEQAASTGIGSAEATTVPPPVAAVHATSPSAAAPSSPPASSGRPATTQPSTTPAGARRLYSTVGGTVVLTLFPNSAVLDAATPAAGYSVQRFVESDMVEVVFTPGGGGTVYEVIATWNGTSPQVQTDAVGG